MSEHDFDSSPDHDPNQTISNLLHHYLLKKERLFKSLDKLGTGRKMKGMILLNPASQKDRFSPYEVNPFERRGEPACGWRCRHMFRKSLLRKILKFDAKHHHCVTNTLVSFAPLSGGSLHFIFLPTNRENSPRD